MVHLCIVLDILKHHKLYAKASKCVFGCKEMEYLGHVIFMRRVKLDPLKITAMVEWHVPKNPKALRGLPGLTKSL